MLGYSLSSSSPLKGTTLVWIKYHFTSLCWYLFVRRRSFVIVSVPAHKILMAIAVRLLHNHMALNFCKKKKTVLQLNGFMCNSLKGIKENVTFTSTEGKK